MRTLALLTLTLLCSAATGCAHFTIEPGIWALEFNLVKSSASGKDEPLAIKQGPMEVEVTCDFAKSPTDGSRVETVEIWLVEPFDPEYDHEERRELDPISGVVEPREGQAPRLKLRGKDRWEFAMFADVRSPIQIKGVLFGRPKLDEDVTVEGNWSMRRIADE